MVCLNITEFLEMKETGKTQCTQSGDMQVLTRCPLICVRLHYAFDNIRSKQSLFDNMTVSISFGLLDSVGT